MTETAPERLGAIRTALAELVDEHGSELLSNPARMSNLIKDLLPDDQQLARILVIAAEQDLAAKLREHISRGMDAATAIRLVATSFAASTMFAQQACLWVVSELAIAMGLASGESTMPVAGDSGLAAVRLVSPEPEPAPAASSGPGSQGRRRGLCLPLSSTTPVDPARVVGCTWLSPRRPSRLWLPPSSWASR